MQAAQGHLRLPTGGGYAHRAYDLLSGLHHALPNPLAHLPSCEGPDGDVLP